MQNEKKYCIRLRFIEPPRVIARVRTRRAHERARSSARSAKASVSQVHSTITRRHTPLIFAHVFLPGQRLRRNFYLLLSFPSRTVRGPEVETFFPFVRSERIRDLFQPPRDTLLLLL